MSCEEQIISKKNIRPFLEPKVGNCVYYPAKNKIIFNSLSSKTDVFIRSGFRDIVNLVSAVTTKLTINFNSLNQGITIGLKWTQILKIWEYHLANINERSRVLMGHIRLRDTRWTN